MVSFGSFSALRISAGVNPNICVGGVEVLGLVTWVERLTAVSDVT